MTAAACSRWSITRPTVGSAGSIVSGCSISPKTPSRAASARNCSSERLRGVSLTARQPACVTQIRPSYDGEAFVEESRRCMREVEDHAQLCEAREQRPAEP